MKDVILFIFRNNHFFKALKYLIIGSIYQIFKRLTKNVISIQIFNGKQIFLFPNSTVSSEYVYTDIPDKAEIKILRDLVRKDDFFLDIGANIGSYSVCLMDLTANIRAFEPHPFTAARCKMNFLLNNFPAANVSQIALSNSNGFAHFTDKGSSSTTNTITQSCTENESIEVEMKTLDSFVLDNNLPKDGDYILKIDVEGHERQLFEGASIFLTSYNIKGLVFECFDETDTFALLKKYGFLSFKKISENNYFTTKAEYPNSTGLKTP